MNAEKGNVLFIILIAAALFGALSYAATQGMRSGGKDISKDQAGLYADEILDYSKSVEVAVQRMMARGVSENSLCFDIDQYPGGNNGFEHAACADTKNRVYHPNGGGISYKDINTDALDSANSANSTYALPYIQSGYQMVGIGQESVADLLVQVNFVMKDVCLAINNALGILNDSGDVFVESNTAASVIFKGIFAAAPVADTLNDGGVGYEGKSVYCRKTSGGTYQFIHVLLAR
jgi:hypothetical protein